jgi:hypothetical protein
MLLTWDDKGCLGLYHSGSRSTFYVHATGWSRGLEVSGGGSGVVSHAGLVLLHQLADIRGMANGRNSPCGSERASFITGAVYQVDGGAIRSNV